MPDNMECEHTLASKSFYRYVIGINAALVVVGLITMIGLHLRDYPVMGYVVAGAIGVFVMRISDAVRYCKRANE